MTVAQVQQLAQQRAAQGFTAIQLVATFPPEVSTSSPHAKHADGWALDENGQINQAYFTQLDAKIAAILDAGLTPIIYGSWGNHIDALGVECMCRIWQELLDRYSTFPVLWCVCGEVDLPPAATWLHNFPFNTKLGPLIRTLVQPLKPLVFNAKSWRTKRLANWNLVGEYIAAHDPQHRPILIHPHMEFTARELFPKAEWLSANSFQSGHDLSRLDWLRQKAVQAYQAHDPALNLEPWYEGLGGNFGAQLQRHAFWASMLSGCIGYAYGAQGLWNMNQPGEAFLGHWGNTDWQTAAAAPGAAQIGAAAKWLRTKKWYGRFAPLPNTDTEKDPLKQTISAKTPDQATVVYAPTQESRAAHMDSKATFFDPITLQERDSKNIESPDCIILLPA